MQDMALNEVDKHEEKKRENHRCQPEDEKTGSDFCCSADTGFALSGVSNVRSLFPMYRISGGCAPAGQFSGKLLFKIGAMSFEVFFCIGV